MKAIKRDYSGLNSNLGKDITGMTVHEKLDLLISENGKGTTITNIGTFSNKTTATFDVSNYENYKDFTVDNFIVNASHMTFWRSGAWQNTFNQNITKSYNENTGVLTVTVGQAQTDYYYGYLSGNVYLVV